MSKLVAGAREEWESWAVPEVRPGGGSGGGRLLTARQLEQLHKQAHAEGFEQGRREGDAAGRKNWQARIARLENILQRLTTPLTDLDKAVEQELAQLALIIARQLIRRELKTDPGQVVAVVREALGVLPVAARNVRLHLHPEDVTLVREALALHGTEQTWTIVADPVLARGGCSVSTDNSYIDASIEARLNSIAANVLGGERETDS